MWIQPLLKLTGEYTGSLFTSFIARHSNQNMGTKPQAGLPKTTVNATVDSCVGMNYRNRVTGFLFLKTMGSISASTAFKSLGCRASVSPPHTQWAFCLGKAFQNTVLPLSTGCPPPQLLACKDFSQTNWLHSFYSVPLSDKHSSLFLLMLKGKKNGSIWTEKTCMFVILRSFS